MSFWLLSACASSGFKYPGGLGAEPPRGTALAVKWSIYRSLTLGVHHGRGTRRKGEENLQEEIPMTETRRPDVAAYVVRDREDKKSNWREVGIGFAHKDGKGFDLLLDAVPVGGRLVVRTIEDKAE